MHYARDGATGLRMGQTMNAAVMGQVGATSSQWAAAGARIGASVRVAQREEADAVAALVNRAYAVETFFVDGHRTTPGEVETLATRGELLVLDGEQGDLVAAVHVRQGGEHGERGEFAMLSVDPTAQGQGLGRRMVAVAEALCEAMGCKSVELRVASPREELPGWYRRQGYAETGTAPYQVSATKQPCHFIEMRKPLDARASS